MPAVLRDVVPVQAPASVEIGKPDPAIAFDYLLREPRHVRRLRRWLHITASLVTVSAIACVLYSCA